MGAIVSGTIVSRIEDSGSVPVIIVDEKGKRIVVRDLRKEEDTQPYPIIGPEADTKPMRATTSAALRIESLLLGHGFGEEEG